MIELLAVIAKVVSFDEQVKMLEEALLNYKSVPSEENRKNLLMPCILISTGMITEKHELEKVFKQISHQRRINERFKDEEFGS